MQATERLGRWGLRRTGKKAPVTCCSSSAEAEDIPAAWSWFSWAGPCRAHGETEAQVEEGLLGITESQGRQGLRSRALLSLSAVPPAGPLASGPPRGSCLGLRSHGILSTAGDRGRPVPHPFGLSQGAAGLGSGPYTRSCPGPLSEPLGFLCLDRGSGLDPQPWSGRGPAPHMHWPAPSPRQALSFISGPEFRQKFWRARLGQCPGLRASSPARVCALGAVALVTELAQS